MNLTGLFGAIWTGTWERTVVLLVYIDGRGGASDNEPEDVEVGGATLGKLVVGYDVVYGAVLVDAEGVVEGNKKLDPDGW